MVLHRVALLAFAILALVAGGLRLTAEEPKTNNRLDALATRLGLSDDQKEKVRKIHTDFDSKEDPLETQLWALHHEEREAVSKVLTKEQREKMPELIKQEWSRIWAKVADDLGMDNDQKRQLRKINDEYGPQFRKLAEEASERSDKVRGQFRKLRREEFAAVRKVLTEDQRAKMPGILREDLHQWRNPVARQEVLKGLCEKLDLSADQKDQVKKVHEEYAAKVKKPADELRQLHKEEHQAMEEVLTEAQRTKLRDLQKSRGRTEKE